MSILPHTPAGESQSAPRRKYLRRKKLIKPRLQLKVIGSFFGISALAFLLQYLFLGYYLTEAAGAQPDGGQQMMGVFPGALLKALMLSFSFLLPLTLAVGIFTTFRLAGPLYRFEKFLQGVRDREQVDACRLRKGDELQDLCLLINEVTAPLREANGRDHGRDDSTETRQAG